jgi:hypothetical protein
VANKKDLNRCVQIFFVSPFSIKTEKSMYVILKYPVIIQMKMHNKYGKILMVIVYLHIGKGHILSYLDF